MMVYMFLAIGLGIGSKKFSSLKKIGFFFEKSFFDLEYRTFHEILFGG